MDHFTFQPDQVLADGTFDQSFHDASSFYPHSSTATWPLPLDQTTDMSHNHNNNNLS
jgi:hypothetical protein